MDVPTRKRLPRLDRRAQLIAVASSVFAERGFEGTSIEEIAERAGVSRPIVYDHFGDKARLYRVVVDEHVSELVNRISGALGAATGRERLEATVVRLLSYVQEHPEGFALITQDQLFGGGPGEISDLITEIARRATEVFSRDLERIGSNPEAAPVYAFALIGMVSMVGIWWRQTKALPLEEVAKHLVAVGWTGLRNLPAEPSLKGGSVAPSGEAPDPALDRSA